MEQGLAAMSAGLNTYGDGSNNTVRHSYGGTVDKPKKDSKKMSCKKNKPKGR